MNQAERILAKFQCHPDPQKRTQNAIAEACGVSQSTVAMWKARGRIPGTQQDAVLAGARKAGINLEPADFFDLPDQPQKSPPATPKKRVA